MVLADMCTQHKSPGQREEGEGGEGRAGEGRRGPPPLGKGTPRVAVVSGNRGKGGRQAGWSSAGKGGENMRVSILAITFHVTGLAVHEL